MPDTAKCFICVVSLEASVLIAARSDTWWQGEETLRQSSLNLCVKANPPTQPLAVRVLQHCTY